MSAGLVVDASVTAQLVLEESATGSADFKVLHDSGWNQLLAPSILVSETAAAITRKLRRKEISLVSAREAFAEWREMLMDGVFEFVPANDLIDPAFALSLRLNHPLHDCLYIALAQRQGCALATRDPTMADKAGRLGLQAELIGV